MNKNKNNTNKNNNNNEKKMKISQKSTDFTRQALLLFIVTRIVSRTCCPFVRSLADLQCGQTIDGFYF